MRQNKARAGVGPRSGSEFGLVDHADPVVRTEVRMEVTPESINRIATDAGCIKDEHFKCHSTFLGGRKFEAG